MFSIVSFSTFLKCLNDAGYKAGAIVVADFTEKNDIGINLCHFIGYGFKSSLYDASFMPDVELQDGEMRGWGRIATPTCYSYAAKA